MPTTTIRLSEELKGRISRAAERVGKTTHAFILEAVAGRVDDEESRNDFYDTAEQRYAKIVASGKTIPWSEMRTYLEERVVEKSTTHPVARKLSD
jgi:predicted transcriptional regulator